jgi:hypothetical protein
MHLCKYAMHGLKSLEKKSCDSKLLLIRMAVLQHRRGGSLPRKDGIGVFGPAGWSSLASSSTAFHVLPESGIRQPTPGAMPERRAHVGATAAIGIAFAISLPMMVWVC